MFINDFEYFLRTVKKCRTNTLWGYMIVLKHIISIARNDGRLPFKIPLRDISILPKAWTEDISRKRRYTPWWTPRCLTRPTSLWGTCFCFRCSRVWRIPMWRTLQRITFKHSLMATCGIITRRKNINTKSNIRLLDVPRKIIEKHKGMTRNGHVSPVSSNPPAIRYWKKSANNVVSRHD